MPKGTKLTDHVALAVGDLMGYPKTFREAMRSPDRVLRATQKEMNVLDKNEAWDLVPKPENFPVIDYVRWVFTMKFNDLGEPDTAKRQEMW